MSYKKQELLTLREHPCSSPVLWWVRVAHISSFLCCPIMCLYVLVPCCDARYEFRIKQCSVRLYPHMFVGWLMPYLCYLCSLHSAFQHILIIWVTWRVSYKRQELLSFASTWVHKRLFGGVRFTNLFSFLYCSFMYLYVVSSVLRCPWRFPYENDVRFVFISRCL